MNNQNTLTLVNPTNGNLAFKILFFESNAFFDHIQRNNYYSLIWIKEGSGILKSDFSEYKFSTNHLLSFSPYQPFMLIPNGSISGVALQFHPDFFCIHKHQTEVACNGVLFNNIYQPPFVLLDTKSTNTLQLIIEQICFEMQNPALAQTELLVSYLKIFLITASRLKTEQHKQAKEDTTNTKEPFILQSLKDAIEAYYREKHAVNEYAEMLNITPKSLAKITKTHLNKNLTTLISERIIIEAKRELYLTNKPIKQIAYELGYQDEYYFSRFFKTNTEISPQVYRNTVGFDRQAKVSIN
ncbi:AraC family transcriptional regulator [Emticicia aquatilis]|uniref:AraC family transcriptional regulator n=1 Tax=Emticicia aquatilis TaxID=1537369 RepID=A0A917DKG2_9BACT|nr:helix-turn-helix domain-containing protein [Emticicia aquatilis]GGD43387.1 AraC family transcriptional regulator [Emticicia aquatilis]